MVRRLIDVDLLIVGVVKAQLISLFLGARKFAALCFCGLETARGRQESPNFETFRKLRAENSREQVKETANFIIRQFVHENYMK
jgi:hypothetical protein